MCSLTPLEREYGSLVCLQYYDLRDEILEAKPRDLVEAEPAQIKQMQDIYTVNEPQAKAIISATNGLGFTLIQGYVTSHIPPGTMLTL
jgi:senataxin